MKTMYKKTILITFIVILLDQLSKGLIDKYIATGESIKVIDKLFYLTNISNTGAAWGMLPDKTNLLVVLTVIVLIILIQYMQMFKNNNRNILAFGLLYGGILGNLIDRLFLGYVKDFLEFHIFDYIFPIFNISDICIVIGAILLIIAIINGEDKKIGIKSAKYRRKRTAR
ncbi:MAG TPA: signal peptidase II [Bacilli bacterium]|nr:signal peptidase II [Bacilli bacterium]